MDFLLELELAACRTIEKCARFLLYIPKTLFDMWLLFVFKVLCFPFFILAVFKSVTLRIVLDIWERIFHKIMPGYATSEESYSEPSTEDVVRYVKRLRNNVASIITRTERISERTSGEETSNREFERTENRGNKLNVTVDNPSAKPKKRVRFSLNSTPSSHTEPEERTVEYQHEPQQSVQKELLKSRLAMTNSKMEEVIRLSNNIFAEISMLNQQVEQVNTTSSKITNLQQALGEWEYILREAVEERDGMRNKFLALDQLIKEQEEYLNTRLQPGNEDSPAEKVQASPAENVKASSVKV